MALRLQPADPGECNGSYNLPQELPFMVWVWKFTSPGSYP